jgi:hypothetical protein
LAHPVTLSTENNSSLQSLLKLDDEEEFTPEEIAAIQCGLDDIENGRTHRMLEGESFDDFLIRIEPCLK